MQASSHIWTSKIRGLRTTVRCVKSAKPIVCIIYSNDCFQHIYSKICMHHHLLHEGILVVRAANLSILYLACV